MRLLSGSENNLTKPEMNQFHKYYFALKKAKISDKKVRKRPCLPLLRDTLDSEDLNEHWMNAKKPKLIKKTLLLKDASENHLCSIWNSKKTRTKNTKKAIPATSESVQMTSL